MNIDSNTVRRILLIVIIIVVGFLLFNFETRSSQIGKEQTKTSETVRGLEKSVYDLQKTVNTLQTTVDELQKQFNDFDEAYGNHINDSEKHNF